jgi:hypothetical protein
MAFRLSIYIVCCKVAKFILNFWGTGEAGKALERNAFVAVVVTDIGRVIPFCFFPPTAGLNYAD